MVRQNIVVKSRILFHRMTKRALVKFFNSLRDRKNWRVVVYYGRQYQYMHTYLCDRIVSNQANPSIFFSSIFIYLFGTKTPVLATCYFYWVWTEVIKEIIHVCLSFPPIIRSEIVRIFLFSKSTFKLFTLVRAV